MGGNGITVVNVRYWQRPVDVYIGRACRGWQASKWANPFKLPTKPSEEQRAECLEKYAKWIVERPDLMAAIGELRGKTLGCWCAPKPCHGDILKALAETEGVSTNGR